MRRNELGQGGSSAPTALVRHASATGGRRRFFEGPIMTDTDRPRTDDGRDPGVHSPDHLRRRRSGRRRPRRRRPPEPEPVEAASPALMDETPSMQEPEPAHEEEDILELTDRYEAPAVTDDRRSGCHGPGHEPEPEPFPTSFAEPERPVFTSPRPAPRPCPMTLSWATAPRPASASAFAGLSAAFRQPEPVPTGGVGPTIDDLARVLAAPDAEGLARRQPARHRRGGGKEGSRTHRPQRRLAPLATGD